MNRRTTIVAFIACLIVVALAAAFASKYPDGLEVVAQKLGFAGRAADLNLIPTPMRGYSVPFIKSTWVSTFLAGAVGAATAAVFFWVVRRIITRK